MAQPILQTMMPAITGVAPPADVKVTSIAPATKPAPDTVETDVAYKVKKPKGHIIVDVSKGPIVIYLGSLKDITEKDQCLTISKKPGGHHMLSLVAHEDVTIDGDHIHIIDGSSMVKLRFLGDKWIRLAD